MSLIINMSEIPIIDLSEFNSGSTARYTVVKQVYQACHEIGFMYLRNPGRSQNFIAQLFIESKHFFSLPDEVKHQLAWSDKFNNQGYVGIERERLDPAKPGDLNALSGLQRLQRLPGNHSTLYTVSIA